MIEPDCAGCTNSQDVQPQTRNRQYLYPALSTPVATPTTKAPAYKHQLQQQAANQRNSPFQSRLASPSINPTSSVSLQSRLSYFQHNNLQPLVGPHLLLASSAAGSAPSPLGASAQFALTPDARACVTATYLCVLIVNNTWLDCNLLETLCNSTSQSQESDRKNSSNSALRKQDEYKLAAAAEASLKLDALESALSELIAFAGGGGSADGFPRHEPGLADDVAEGESSAPDGVYQPLTHYFRSEEPGTSSQRPMEPYVDKGGGKAPDIESGGETSEDDDDEHGDNPDSNARFIVPSLARLSLLSDTDTDTENGQANQMFANNGPSNGVTLDDNEKIVEHYMSSKQTQLKKHFGVRQQVDNSSSSTTAGVSSGQFEPSGSLTSWVGRPFRGWSSYSFWSSGTGSGAGNGQQIIRLDEAHPQQGGDQQKQQQQQVQLLRPVDRTEQYNDIATNQSSIKRHNHHQQQQNDQQPDNSGHQAPTDQQAGLSNAPNPVANSANPNGPVRGGSNSKKVDDNNSNHQSVFFLSQTPTTPQSQLLFVEHLAGNHKNHPTDDEANYNNEDGDNDPSNQQLHSTQSPFPILRPPTTLASSLLGAYDASDPNENLGSYAATMTTGSIQRQPQTDRNHHMQHHQHYQGSQNEIASLEHQYNHHLHQLQQQKQQQRQQQQSVPQSFHSEDKSSSDHQVPCRCNEVDPTQLPHVLSDECRFRCPSQASVPSQSSDTGTQLTTASTFAAPTPTLGPSAKMSPLDVTFLLYTRNNRDQAVIGLNTSNETSQLVATTPAAGDPALAGPGQQQLRQQLNSSLPIKIVIHGFGSGGRRPWVTDMVYKLLDYEDVNVIVVDWEKGAALPNYVQAAGNTRLVGHKIAGLIRSINAKYGLTGNSYHLIGFSLGAHVAGFAGMEIRNSTNAPHLWINRITGLDPASPLFEGYEPSDRLDPSDAQFVDVIHSNGDGVLRGGFGSLQPMGHVDFYPNGGRVQVGCNSVLLSALSDIIYGKWQSLCNHRRALNFFMDSFEFNKCRFRSFNCDSYENYLKGECFDCGLKNEKCSYMGYLANYSKGRGKMYLTTHEEAPFCANQFIIKIVGTKGFKTHWGKVEVTLVTLDGKNESFWLSSTSQQSTNHELGGGQKELSQQQHCMQSLIVAHPVLVNFAQVLLRYTKYKGWIYSGDESWSIDKVFITDSDGQVKSYCGFNTILESHITSRLNLEPGNCTVVEPIMAIGGASGLSANSNGGQQTSRIGNEVNSSPSGAGLVVASSSLPQQQSQQQQSQSQTQPSQPQQQQVQTLQSPRTPRFDYSTLSQPLSHAFQRIPTERPVPFTIGYSNIPYIASF